jgi:hypothetical protein
VNRETGPHSGRGESPASAGLVMAVLVTLLSGKAVKVGNGWATSPPVEVANDELQSFLKPLESGYRWGSATKRFPLWPAFADRHSEATGSFFGFGFARSKRELVLANLGRRSGARLPWSCRCVACGQRCPCEPRSRSVHSEQHPRRRNQNPAVSWPGFMMEPSSLRKALVISMVFICFAPASAAAKRGYFATDPSSSMQVQLRGSNGYGMSLSGGAGYVLLSITGHHAAVQYVADGAAGQGRIKARFGSLGRVALRFHARGPAHLHKDREGGCRGGDSLIQPGVFVGTLDFEGEQGYAAIHASRIKGTVTHTKRQVCKNNGGEEGLPSFPKLTLVSAAADKSGISFNALRVESKSKPGRSGVGFNATVVESPPGLSVSRSIQVTAADPSVFSVVTSHGHVDEATVTPPAPFSGSATYRRAVAKKETWAGSLAGDFPGLGMVSLAGPEFCAEGALLQGCNGAAAWLVGLFG